MKNLLLCTFILCTISLCAQESNEESSLSKHGFTLNFSDPINRIGAEVGYSHYRTDKNILQFTFRGQLNSIGSSLNFGFWNEHRRYLTKYPKWYFTQGLTANIGYSSFDFSYLGNKELSWSGSNVGAGWKLGVGRQFGNKAAVSLTANPKMDYFFLDKSNNLISDFRLSAPIQLGLNFRF